MSAHLLEQIRRAREFGIEVSEPKINWGLLLERKNKVVKQLTSGVRTLLAGRQAVLKLPSRDWADYILYGNFDFVLKQGKGS